MVGYLEEQDCLLRKPFRLVNESPAQAHGHSVFSQIADFDSHEDAMQEFRRRQAAGKHVLFLRWIEEEGTYEEIHIADDDASIVPF